MPEQHRTCPDCSRLADYLHEASRESMVYYYRCSHCGCVWNVRKNDPTWTTMITGRGKPPSDGAPAA